ncbi:sulfatase-like hydrolase/transferase [Myxococcota bacterium]|nr:sulfatase-like hydrolase/transferase [Myxococcota bacterium]MCZ7619542.1 sulfatase-like hydrolase/transferase [Myxococcota bacterium]
MRAALAAVWLASALLCASAAVARDDAKPPNILLIVTDQHHHRALGAAGEPVVQTPSLDRLASQGIRFTAGYSNYPVCGPARYAMFTGHYPTELGTFDNEVAPRPGFRHIQSYLADAGYFTASVGKLHYAPYGETHGFEHVYHHEFLIDASGISHYAPWLAMRLRERGLPPPPPLLEPSKDWYLTVSGLTGTNPLPEELTAEAWTTDKALRMIARAQAEQRPFFVHASYFPPHHPYVPLPKYLDLYRDAEMKLPHSFYAAPGAKPFGGLSEADFREIRRHYFGSVSQVDHQIGRLLDGLDALGLAGDTLVFFVSDHGDLMGEFRLLTKSEPYEGSIRIPFLVRWPGRIEPGRVSGAPVSLVDVLPTILDAAGIPIPPQLRGQSILPLARGEETSPGERNAYALEVSVKPFRFLVVREERWKLTCRPRVDGSCEYRLVDLVADPDELDDRSTDPAARAHRDRLAAKLDAFWRRESAFVPSGPLPTRLPRARIDLPVKN